MAFSGVVAHTLPAMEAIDRARKLRQSMPDIQRRMWRLLRDRRFSGYKFRREHPVGPYVLDFYCSEAKLSLELDGMQHGSLEHQQLDEKKEQYLASRGILTKRFWNSQIRREPGVVKENLWLLLQQRAPHPENMPVTPNARSRKWSVPPASGKVPL